MSKTHDGDIYPAPPQPPTSLAHALADMIEAAWRVSWRVRGAQAELSGAVSNLAERLADANGLDEFGRSPAELQAEADQLAELEALDDEDGPEDGEAA